MIYDDALKLDYFKIKRCSEEISPLNVCNHKYLYINNIDEKVMMCASFSA